MNPGIHQSLTHCTEEQTKPNQTKPNQTKKAFRLGQYKKVYR